jgi:hypothetical protein
MTKDLIRRISSSLSTAYNETSDIIPRMKKYVNKHNPAFQSITLTDGESN